MVRLCSGRRVASLTSSIAGSVLPVQLCGEPFTDVVEQLSYLWRQAVHGHYLWSAKW